jgi:hypothetical protein
MSLKTRVEWIRRGVELEHGAPARICFVTVICNGCGQTVMAPTVLELLPRLEGWELGDLGADADRCPECQ